MSKFEANKIIDLTKRHKIDISRRGFLSKVGVVSAGAMFAGCSNPGNIIQPEASNPESPPVLRPAPVGTPQSDDVLATVATADCFNYDRANIRRQIESMFDEIGGLADIIKTGDKVGIKVNLTGGVNNFGKVNYQPFNYYLNHPEICRAVVELVKDAGAASVHIVEAVYEWESFTFSDPLSGLSYEKIANETGAVLVDLNQTAPYGDYMVRQISDGLIYHQLTQNGILDEFDCFISLPKTKRHAAAGVTNAMKNLVGTLPVPAGLYNSGQNYRKAIHNHPNKEKDLVRVVIDLNKATPIHLSVSDIIHTVLKGEGPWIGFDQNDKVEINKLVAAKHDMVAADAVATSLLGFNPMSDDYDTPWDFKGALTLNYLKLADELGMGTHDLAKINVIDVTETTGVEYRG